MNRNCENAIISEDYFDFIADYDITSRETSGLEDICVIRIDSSFATLYVPMQTLPRDLLTEYGYKVFVRLFGLLDLPSLEESNVTRLRNMPGLDLRGQDVLIGFVDTGIDYTHDAFLYGDGTTKIVSIWDQTIESGNAPEGFLYGTQYSREQINIALQNSDPRSIVPSTDEIGHGTFIAGIAAGNLDMDNDFSGVVPDAEIVMVKLKPAKQNIRDLYLVSEEAVCYQENDIMLGVKYLIEIAKELNRPISICIGLGTTQGSHDIYGALNIYLNTVSQMDGIAVSIGAGNEGNSRLHFESLMGIGKNTETVDLNVGENEPGFMMEIWGDAPNTFAIELITPSGEFVPSMIPRLGESREVDFIFENTIIHIIFKLVGSKTGAQLVIVKFQNPTEGLWKFRIQKMNTDFDLRYNIWLPMSGFMNSVTYFIDSSPYTTLTSPANTFTPAIITAYNNNDNSLYLNASRGYTRLGTTAPDLAAPGVNILGPSLGNGYRRGSGTSIAAAHTAGVAAMLLEWGKVRGNLVYMDGTDVRNLLIRGARREPNRDYPNREWGYGILDILGTYESLRGH